MGFKMSKLPIQLQKLVNNFAKTIKLPKKESPHPIALGPFGPCCAGKTTTVKYLLKELPFVHIEHDGLRVFMRKRGFDKDTEMNQNLYKYLLIIHLAKHFLNKGYSVILDRNFAIMHDKSGKVKGKFDIKRWEGLLGIKLFLIRIKAPKWFVIKKIRTTKIIPREKGGIFASRDDLMKCYLDALKYDYERLAPQVIGVVDTSKPIPPQIKKFIPLLKREMGL